MLLGRILPNILLCDCAARGVRFNEPQAALTAPETLSTYASDEVVKDICHWPKTSICDLKCISPQARPFSSNLGKSKMVPERLAALEQAAEPYINSGYHVFSQTDTSLTLMRPRPRFSVIMFIILLIVFWPVAIIYSVANRSRRDKVVCLRITSQGYIEETGDALDSVNERVNLTTIIIVVVSAVIATLVLLLLIRG